MILRTWRCLNQRCGKAFDSYEKGNPDCVHCGCARVQWIPGGGHIGTKSAAVDATVRSLASNYAMTEINTPSHSRLNRAMPKFAQRQPDLPVKHFAPGFSAPMSSQGPTCQESESRVDVRGQTTINRQLPANGRWPSPMANTEIHGRFTGPAR